MPALLPSLQAVDTLSVRIGWQVQLVLLFQSRWHETTPQVVVATSKLGCRLFGCCQGDEQVWPDPSSTPLLHILSQGNVDAGNGHGESSLRSGSRISPLEAEAKDGIYQQLL